MLCLQEMSDLSIRATDIRQAYFWIPFGVFECISMANGSLFPISSYLFEFENWFTSILGIVAIFPEFVSPVFLIIGLYAVIKGEG